ncbi:hypothetical protein ABPG75_012636 [Micractinium tetrahymenae]
MEGRHSPPGQLRLLMVSDFFYPNTGGVESHIYQLSQCLLARGHKVVVLTHAYGDRAGVRHLTNGLKVYYAPRLAFTQAVTFPTFFGGFRLLRAILLRERITLVHAHQAFSTMAHEAIMHARTMGYPVVFTDHSLFGFADASSILMNKVLKYTLADVHHVICVSHTSKENTVLRACIPPTRVSVIPNAVDASLFEPEPPQQAQQQAQHERRQRGRRREQQQGRGGSGTDNDEDSGSRRGGSSNGTITGVALSRLVYRKGIDLLAAVLPELCERHPHLQFLIGGDGPKRPLLEAVVREHGLEGRVSLVGAVPHERVRQLLVRGHIFLNCSLTEAFCMALVEAAAAGLLVVSTRVGGVPEVLPDDMLLLADPSPEGLVEAVGEAVQRVETGGRDAWAQHAAVRDMYSWQAITQRTERVYWAVLRGCSCGSCGSSGAGGRRARAAAGGEAQPSGSRGGGPESVPSCAACVPRDDSMVGRLRRYHKCGTWFGKICCCITAVDWLYWQFLEWWQPACSIEPAPDFPPLQQGQACHC